MPSAARLHRRTSCDDSSGASVATIVMIEPALCSRRGGLLWFAPRDQFKLLSGQDDLTTYTFNKHVIQHQFCKHCGVQSFALGQNQRGDKMAAINIRCLENFEFDKVPVKHIDGRAF